MNADLRGLVDFMAVEVAQAQHDFDAANLSGHAPHITRKADRLRQMKAVSERLSVAQGQGWLPIESAPKDELILVGPTKRMGICAAMNHSRDGWVTETCSEWMSIYTPTHWQPLPAAPAQPDGVE